MRRPPLRTWFVVIVVVATAQCGGTPAGSDPLVPPTAPDVGEHCADGLTASDLTEFFRSPIGSFEGGDYQQATRLPDDRVLWTFHDGFLAGEFVHNVGLLQSGRCFTILNDDGRSWLFADETVAHERWFWPLASASTVDGERVAIFVAEMSEQGDDYLAHAVPVRTHRVEVDLATMSIVRAAAEPATPPDLYGWSVTDDGQYSYLYSHCSQQFGSDSLLGFGPCVEFVKVARSPSGDFDAPRAYWDGVGWSSDPAAAVAVVDREFVGSRNNPAQVRFDGEGFALVEKPDDWFGTTVEFGYSTEPTGPFEHTASVAAPDLCDRSTCTTYFAAWVPWDESDGAAIWSISCNVWDGDRTCDQLDRYGPRFASTVDVTP